jgi:hypothetical protein
MRAHASCPLQLIITGRDAVQRVVESFWRKRNAIIEEEASLRERGVLSPDSVTGVRPITGRGLGGDLGDGGDARGDSPRTKN